LIRLIILFSSCCKFFSLQLHTKGLTYIDLAVRT
jgi:hypothetical protein